MRLISTGGEWRRGADMALPGLLMAGFLAAGTVLAISVIDRPAWAEGGSTGSATSEAEASQTDDATNETQRGKSADESDQSEDAEDSKTDDYDGPPRRVVLRVNQFETVMGTIELEDDAVIVVKRLNGEVESYSKLQLLQVVRLKDPQPGQRGTVHLLNGQTREGVILEDGFEHVVLEIEGIRTQFKREDVDFIELRPTVQQRYERFKEQLSRDRPEQHLLLCEWLFEQRMYDEARAELNELMSYHPTAEATKLMRIVDAQIELRERTKRAEETGRADERRRRLEEARARRAAMEAKLLSENDVNLIRVYEIDFRRPPRVAVSRDLIAELIEKYSEQPEMPATKRDKDALYRQDPLEIVELIFELRARDLYPQIKVLSEPYALNVFRRRVHNTWLMNTCATSGCHGGPDAGRLQLFNENSAEERVRYTNLLILERLELDPEWPLINYDDPEQSLIIQYGLPRNMARKPHPDVPGWRPAFRDRDDRLVAETVRWIELMLKPRVEYPVALDPILLKKPDGDRGGPKPASGDEGKAAEEDREPPRRQR